MVNDSINCQCAKAVGALLKSGLHYLTPKEGEESFLCGSETSDPHQRNEHPPVGDTSWLSIQKREKANKKQTTLTYSSAFYNNSDLPYTNGSGVKLPGEV